MKYEIKIPKTIKIAGLDYTVEMNGDTDRDLQARQRRGECSGYQRRIRVESQLIPQDTSLTFIHEVCHAINQNFVNDDLSEADVASIASGLHQVLEELGVRFVK